MSLLEALLAVAVVAAGLAIVVDIAERSAEVDAAVMLREDVDAIREAVVQSQSAAPKNPLAGWFDQSGAEPEGGRPLSEAGDAMIRRFTNPHFGRDNGLGFNPLSGDGYSVVWRSFGSPAREAAKAEGVDGIERGSGRVWFVLNAALPDEWMVKPDSSVADLRYHRPSGKLGIGIAPGRDADFLPEYEGRIFATLTFSDDTSFTWRFENDDSEPYGSDNALPADMRALLDDPVTDVDIEVGISGQAGTGAGGRHGAAFVETTLFGPDDARLAAGALLGRPVEVVPRIDPANHADDQRYSLRVRVAQSAKALYARGYKGRGSDFVYGDEDGDGELEVVEVPIQRGLSFSEPLEIPEGSTEIKQGADCEGDRFFVTKRGEFVSCQRPASPPDPLPAGYDPDEHRTWQGPGHQPDVTEHLVCSSDRSGANCACKTPPGSSSTDSSLCKWESSTADRATVSADTTGWAAAGEEYIHVCPSGTEPVFLWPTLTSESAKATDGRAFAEAPIDGDPVALRWKQEGGFRCKRKAKCPVWPEQGIWTVLGRHPGPGANQGKAICFVATHDDLMPKFTTPPQLDDDGYVEGWPAPMHYPAAMFVDDYGLVKCETDFLNGASCRFVRQPVLRGNREHVVDCAPGNFGDNYAFEDFVLYKGWCYELSTFISSSFQEGASPNHDRVDSAWSTMKTLAIPPKATWNTHLLGDKEFWPAIGYKPHSVYSHLSCDPFPLAMPPGRLRGALVAGSLTNTGSDPMNGVWCSILSGMDAPTTLKPQPVKVGKASNTCAIPKTACPKGDPNCYVGDQSADGCATTAVAAKVLHACSPNTPCLSHLEIGYDDFISVDENTGILSADMSVFPSKYATTPTEGSDDAKRRYRRNRSLGRSGYWGTGSLFRWRPHVTPVCNARHVRRWLGASACWPEYLTIEPGITGCYGRDGIMYANREQALAGWCYYDTDIAYGIGVNGISIFDITTTAIDMERFGSADDAGYNRPSTACVDPHSGTWNRGGVSGRERNRCHQYRIVAKFEHPTLSATETSRITHILDTTTDELLMPETIAADTSPSYATRKCSVGWPSRDNDFCVVERQRSTTATNEVGDVRRSGSLDGEHTDLPDLEKCGLYVPTFDEAGNRTNAPLTNCLATLCDTHDGSDPVWADCLTSKVATGTEINYGSDQHGWPVFRGLPVGAAPSE